MEDVKIKLSGLWVAHFLIWSFGDILRLLTPGYIADTNISDNILIIAAIIGAIHASMIVVSLLLDNKLNRLSNLFFGSVFLLFDIGHLVDIVTGDLGNWEYILEVVYLTISGLIIWHAYKWSN